MLNRNLSWNQFLGTVLQEVPEGERLRVEPLQKRVVVAAAAAPLKASHAKAKTKGKQAAAAATLSRKRKKIETGSDDEFYEVIEPVPKRAKCAEKERLEAQYDSLLSLTKELDDKHTEKWIKKLYPQHVRSLAFTGRKQTLYSMATILTEM